MSVVYEMQGAPANSVLLLPKRHDALAFPTGTIALAVCPNCHFISNVAFNPALVRYGAGYEATQAYSSTFNGFHRTLARRLVTEFGLHGKEIIEIGCGQGEFLELLCEIGNNRGVGFDPAYLADGNGHGNNETTSIVADFYSEKYADCPADFVCCKMTLEHIPNTAAFVTQVRRSIGTRTDTTVFFQVPDAQRILEEMAFWDIYYEHCSYFCRTSLTRLFQRCGFNIVDSRIEYDGQYLMVVAQPTDSAGTTLADGPKNGIAELAHQLSTCWRGRIRAWRDVLGDLQRKDRRTVLWGGGSKAVAFLTTLKAGDEVAYVVDINPKKHGTFLPGTGHQVLGPDALSAAPPDVIIVMNPIYADEIREQLATLGVGAELILVSAIV